MIPLNGKQSLRKPGLDRDTISVGHAARQYDHFIDAALRSKRSFRGGAFFICSRMRSMISPTRSASPTTQASASLTSPMSGGRIFRKFWAARALLRALAIGCVISWDSEAANSPITLTRFMWAKSDCICCNRASACVRSSMSVSRRTNGQCARKRPAIGAPRLSNHRYPPSKTAGVLRVDRGSRRR